MAMVQVSSFEVPTAPLSGRGASYDVLAPFYDALEGDRTKQVEYLRSLIVTHHPTARSVLELACGTGAVLRQLCSSYEVAGVDLSERMLQVAGEHIPPSRLLQADMTTLALGETFDVVLCVYDSINHLGAFGQWQSVFDRAQEHLRAGGIFLFDMNTVRRLDELIAGPPLARWFGEGNLLLLEVAGDTETEALDHRASRWSVWVFERLADGRYRRHTEDLREVSFSASQVETTLRRRFSEVWSYDPERNQPSDDTRRLHFVCEK
jgi:SAM-dependent methyltransferase